MTTTFGLAQPPPRRNIFFPPPPNAWERFRWNPTVFLAEYLYGISQSNIASTSPSPKNLPIRVVCISDTHNTAFDNIPPGDVLLHAGDLTNSGSFKELQAQITWLDTLPHTHKITIGGNHDLILDEDFVKRVSARVFDSQGLKAKDLDWGDIVYLNDTSVALTIHGRTINVFGYPFTPQYGNWAFQHPRRTDVWAGRVPKGTDILLTHGPPRGHLDMNHRGCEFLNKELERIRPRLCVFGHIHEGRGKEQVCWDSEQRFYDRVVTGRMGWLGVLGLAVAVVIGMVWRRIVRGRNSRGTLINAAMTWEVKKEMWDEKTAEI